MFEVSERMAKISDPELQARLLREGHRIKRKQAETGRGYQDSRWAEAVEIAYFARMTAIT